MQNVFSYTNSKGKTYFLHSSTNTLKGSGRVQTIFFFASEVKTDGKSVPLDAVPDGYEIAETKTGLPVLKKIK